MELPQMWKVSGIRESSPLCSSFLIMNFRGILGGGSTLYIFFGDLIMMMMMIESLVNKSIVVGGLQQIKSGSTCCPTFIISVSRLQSKNENKP
jgi:hypothetical protein